MFKRMVNLIFHKRLSRVLLIAGSLLSATSLVAQTLAAVDFNAGGTDAGFSNAYNKWPGSTYVRGEATGDLTYANYGIVQTGTGGKYYSNATHVDRQDSSALSSSMLGDVWFSILVNVAAGGDFAGISFHSSAPRQAYLHSEADLRVAMSDSQLLVDWNGNKLNKTPDVATGSFSAGTHLILGSMTVMPDSENDTLSIWVDPDVNAAGSVTGLGAATYTNSSVDFTDLITHIGMPGNIGTMARGSKVYMDAIRVSNTASAFDDVTGLNTLQPMLITVNTALGLTVDIPLFGTVSGVMIDWGDGTTPTTGINAEGTQSHNYTAVGTYTVAIRGNFAGYGWQSNSPTTVANVAAITGVIQWNLVGGVPTLTSLDGAFRDHANLTAVPTNIPSSVTDMSRIFRGASTFNQDIGSWNTALVTNMAGMFMEATAFNHDIGRWNTGLMTDMDNMFYGAIAFNQDISSWNTTNVTSMQNMFLDSRLSVNNYDRLITAWDSTAGVTLLGQGFHGGYSVYCTATDPNVVDGDENCAPQIVRVTLADDATTITVTWSEPVVGQSGANLTRSDYVLAITVGSSGTPATLNSTTPESISQNGNSYTLGLDLDGTLNSDQVISVLPVQ